MQNSQTFSILFWINASRAKNNFAEIYVRITVNQRRVNISLKRKTDIDLWDKIKSRVKGRGELTRLTNDYLDQIQIKLFQCYQDLKNEDRIITAKIIKSRFLGTDKKLYSVQDLISYHNDIVTHKLHKDTMKHYRTSQKYVMLFINKKLKASDIHLKSLDYSFVINFESFLRSYQPNHYQKSIGNNAVMKHIQRIHKMIKLAFDLEWIDKDPFVKFKPKLIKTEREFLTSYELKSIENLSISIERLNIVKDLFVFSCYTGICYADIVQLGQNNVAIGIDGNKWIITKRQKTGTPVKVPLLPKALHLIEKYKNHHRTIDNRTLLPKISNQKLNSYLKEVADLSGVTKNLTFHMARHTFATTVTLSNGVPIETVSKLLGHTKIATTQIYARVIEKKVSEDMQKLREQFLNNENNLSQTVIS